MLTLVARLAHRRDGLMFAHGMSGPTLLVGESRSMETH